MTAVLIATSKWLQMERISERYPSAMLPLMDRPFIQHILETLVKQGIKGFEVVVSHLPEKIEALLGDGKRWGVNIRYHLVPRDDRPYRSLKLFDSDPGEHPILLVHADRLVQADIGATKPSSPAGGSVLYYFCNDTSPSGRPERQWSGWGWLSRECLTAIPEDSDENKLQAYLESTDSCRIEETDIFKPLSVQSGGDLIASHCAVLAKKDFGLMVRGREIEEGIWLARNVSLHPTAKLIPPLYIGENSRIAKGARIGPDAVIGHNCVLDEKSTVIHSVVFPGSYVGEALELNDAIVDKNCLVNVRVGSEITIREDFILGSLSEKQLSRGWNRVISRTAAILLLIPTLPVIAGLALYLKFRRCERVFTTRPMVRLPADSDSASWKTFPMVILQDSPLPSEAAAQESEASPYITQKVPASWRHLFFIFLPALINIARGELRFVGVPPRTTGEIEDLPQDWRTLYLKSKPGIVTETLVNFGVRATADDRYSAEAVYSVSSGLKHDVKILMKYFGQILGLAPLPDNSS